MYDLSIHLALHGVMVLTVGVVGGLLLHRSILRDTNRADWHLFHSAASARGILLIALAGVIDLVDLDSWLIATAAWFVIYFVWTSTLAMLIRAYSRETGFRFAGSKTNKFVYVLYASGALVLFPGLLLLAVGFSRAL